MTLNHGKYADLHLHTIFSDGVLAPEQVVLKANHVGLSAVAITDHDAIDGIEPALNAGERYGVEVIPGIELSSELDGEELHILGFFIDITNKDLRNKIYELKESRRIRAIRMIERLDEMGIKLSFNDVLMKAGSASIGRPHIAQAIVDAGYTKTITEAFHKYIGDGCPAFIAKEILSPLEAFHIILNAGGIPVLAHPEPSQVKLLKTFVSAGLKGLEVFHPNIELNYSNYLVRVAKTYQLLITGGSDYHSNDKSMIGDVMLPYKYVQDLKKFKKEW